MALKKGNE